MRTHESPVNCAYTAKGTEGSNSQGEFIWLSACIVIFVLGRTDQVSSKEKE